MKIKGLALFGILHLVVASTMGCNLAIDTQAYPYESIQEIGISAPEIIFTEILPWSSVVVGLSEAERGEFIEIKNVGNVEVEPQEIFIEILEDEDGDPIQTIEVIKPRSQAAIVATKALKPIQPGEYFVFIRYETTKSPLTLDKSKFYDYGEFGEKIELDQNAKRFLRLSFRGEDGIVLSDTLRWNEATFSPDGIGEISMEVDTSIVLDQSKENNLANNDVSSWCLEQTSSLLGGINATPGRKSTCNVSD